MVYRTFWLRVAAVLVDAATLSPLIYLELFAQLSTAAQISVIGLQHAYSIVAHAVYGRTVGKWVVGVKVVRTHEHLPLRWQHALMRELFWIIISICVFGFEDTGVERALVWASMIALIANTILALVHPRNRGIHDFIGKTVVIRRR